MRLSVYAGITALFLLFQAESGIVFSQQVADSTLREEIVIEEVVVTSSMTEVPFSNSLRSIEISTSGDIRLGIQGEMAGLLETLPGVDIRQRGAPGQQADISIRGGSFDQTLVMVNGVNVSDPQTGHHNTDLPFDLNAVGRIELLKGPGARIFGPNAFNGVVNILVREPDKNRVVARVTGGSHGYRDASVTLSLRNNNISDMLSVSHTSSDGYIENTDFANTALFNRLKFTGRRSAFDIQTGYMSKAFGANSFYSPKYPLQFEATKTFFASVKPTFGKIVSPVFYWRRHYDCFELFRRDAPAWYAGHNYHMTDAAGSDMSVRVIEGERFTTSFGYNIRYERILSNKLGDKLTDQKRIPWTDTLMYTNGDDRFNAGIMAEESFTTARWSFSGGVLLNYSSGIKNGFTLYPGLDAGYTLNSRISLYTSVNRTLRQPTFTDLYYNDPVSEGNMALRPEEAWVAECGARYKNGFFRSSIALFRQHGKDMIDWVRPEESEKWHVMNLTEVNITGAELTAEASFRHEKTPLLSYLRVDYTYLYADKNSAGYQSKYLLDILRNKVDVSLSHRITRRVNASWSLCWQDRTGGYTEYVNGVPASAETPFRDVFLIDGRINYMYNGLQLFVSVTNITDTIYNDIGNVRQPGRWIRAGVIIDSQY